MEARTKREIKKDIVICSKEKSIWICRHFCIKLLATLKREQFDSWEFNLVSKNEALYDTKTVFIIE